MGPSGALRIPDATGRPGPAEGCARRIGPSRGGLHPIRAELAALLHAPVAGTAEERDHEFPVLRELLRTFFPRRALDGCGPPGVPAHDAPAGGPLPDEGLGPGHDA